VRNLDPVGWNRRWGWEETEGLKETGLQLDFKAEVVPWHKSGIDDLIAENRAKLPIAEEKNNKVQPKNGRGPKL